ncbi:tetratricopeptide repeat protein [Proteiniborus sp. MB09-C3]|uniref:tetratricopeptide repeat protein n=1 Tax=Proteiniborus sp. MB09-C3 TaxID=3050072 RepID=UPI002552A77F|nr:tetratricopeptide repeat protein [Proteiniborus sp. MB09-C3]WIV12635.1 tetratricopeptide repeat protein [Proteiniborus sp. MB09-C3]
MTEDIEKANDADEIVACLNCSSSVVEPEYKAPLCSECRDKLSNRPIPLWIKAFFGIIFIVTILSLIMFPALLKAGVAYERGARAENERKYITAMNEYERVLNKYPDSTLVLAKLSIAYYENDKIDKAIDAIDMIIGEEAEEDLIDRIDTVMDNIATFYFLNEGLNKILNSSEQDYYTEELVAQLETYVNEHPEDVAGKYYLADALYEFGEFDYAEILIREVINSKPEFHSAYFFLAAICREQERYDEALEYCKEVLSMNAENPGAYITISKIELKRNNDEVALEMAEKAYKLDKDNNQAVSNLSLAYHYNDMISERDNMFNLLVDKNAEYETEFLTSIFNGTYQWR